MQLKLPWSSSCTNQETRINLFPKIFLPKRMATKLGKVMQARRRTSRDIDSGRGQTAQATLGGVLIRFISCFPNYSRGHYETTLGAITRIIGQRKGGIVL